jgi:hypothetical protein
MHQRVQGDVPADCDGAGPQPSGAEGSHGRGEHGDREDRHGAGQHEPCEPPILVAEAAEARGDEGSFETHDREHGQEVDQLQRERQIPSGRRVENDRGEQIHGDRASGGHDLGSDQDAGGHTDSCRLISVRHHRRLPGRRRRAPLRIRTG